MKVNKTTVLEIKLKGEDADDFKAALKCLMEIPKIIGFNNYFTDLDQLEVLKKLNNKLNN